MESTERNIDIFYIEDDEVDILGMEREFKKINELLEIAVAKDGHQALNKLYGRNGEEKLHPKIILLDINLPKMNGIEFLKLLRADPTFIDIEVFILTGAFNTQDKMAMKDLNVRGHIIKPLEYEDALNLLWALQSAPRN
ncbi:response regulator [Legionella oakridgensis]|uniref:Response regulator containing a CheY-like receiver domain and an HTH DNA-binding domain n=2 Tax=Legionella oakridgensis TaxID=29423 RepID=W0B936_9GAMM|nr:response regulator [Legionella oakridgensis]AHE66355.1 response regulator containing a CheY-like receiver domain and an HTH DNA-binding domain [Legionella oakridgensis ATCC 33761 = DSM 21215]ETO93861.1 response regulator [Legionella oakridgensis RV-2-2007]KTD43997.1 two component response regulator [Legionella oakridgensis]STY19539.1 two component response regulator [Legionella longbeachae]